MTSSVGMILPNWMEIHKIPWFQSPPTSSNQCRSRASLSDLSGLNSQRVIPPFNRRSQNVSFWKKNPFAPTKTPLGFWFFPAEIPTLDSLLSLHELQFINENLQSPCLPTKSSTITKSCCWHHLFQVITIEIPTSPFLMGNKSYHHWNPYEIPLTPIKPSLHYHVCPSSSQFHGEHVKHLCETTNQFCFRHQRARMIYETSWN
jgi:hypothetical protein